MAKYRFVATRGIHFSENGTDPWAHFVRQPGEVVHSFETDDAGVAKRLRAVDGYGITEVKSAPVKASE